MTPEARAARAFRVQTLLDDGDIQQAFADVRADFIDEWTRCHDPAQRENLWRAVHVVERVQQVLASYAIASNAMTELKRSK